MSTDPSSSRSYNWPPKGGWALAVQVAIAVVVTLGLSVWQVTRGIEKAELRDLYIDRLDLDPISASDYSEGEHAYRKISLLGRFDENEMFIVAYRRHLGVPGFWAVASFNTDSGKFLVNRGWVPIEGTWFHTPSIETPSELMNLSGVIWPATPQRSTAGYDVDGWPKRVNRPNIEEMARITGSFGDEVRLLSDSEGVLTPIHLSFEQGPSTHWSYAFQWLVIGALIVLGYWYFAVRKHEADT